MESSQHPLDAIAGHNTLKAIKEASKPSESSRSDGADYPKDTERECSLASKSMRTSAPVLHALNLSGIKSPAIVLDVSLRVVWQNKMAIDHIWHCSQTANNGNPTPDIFDLLFDPKFQQTVENWRQWVHFFTQQVLGLMPEDSFQSKIAAMNQRQQDVVSSVLAGQQAHDRKAAFTGSHLRQVLTNGEIRPFNVAAVDFNEERLLTFVPEAGEDVSDARIHSHDIERRYSIVRRNPNPVYLRFGLLSSGLNNASALKAEMLSDEFCRLVNDLCRKCIRTIERYGGIFLKNSDSGFCAYFLPFDEYDDSPCINPVKCALALKEQMTDLSRQWKIHKSWQHELKLDTGIHLESEHVGILMSFLGDSLTNFGGALSIATGLSGLSGSGRIWATKSLINAMPATFQEQLRFGIQRSVGHHRPVFIQNSFANMRDLLPGDGLARQLPGDIESVAVTEIFDLQALP